MDYIVYLEEYKALRAEILALVARQGARLTVAWAGMGALLGVAAVSKIPELGCLALVLVASAWRDHLFLSEGIHRLGAYIAVVLEPAIPGLQWEAALANSYERMSKSRSKCQRIWIAATSTYGVFAIICALSTTLLFGLYPPANGLRWAMGISLAIFAIVIVALAIRQALRIPEKRQYWREQFAARQQACSTAIR